MNDVELLQRAITASTLSARAFAERILSRDERTVRRWLGGEQAIPAATRAWLDRWVAELTDEQRRQVVDALAFVKIG